MGLILVLNRDQLSCGQVMLEKGTGGIRKRTFLGQDDLINERAKLWRKFWTHKKRMMESYSR